MAEKITYKIPDIPKKQNNQIGDEYRQGYTRRSKGKDTRKNKMEKSNGIEQNKNWKGKSFENGGSKEKK